MPKQLDLHVVKTRSRQASVQQRHGLCLHLQNLLHVGLCLLQFEFLLLGQLLSVMHASLCHLLVCCQQDLASACVQPTSFL